VVSAVRHQHTLSSARSVIPTEGVSPEWRDLVFSFVRSFIRPTGIATASQISGCSYGKFPNTATPLVVPTYTRPFAIIGVMNLFPAPNWSRDPASLLL
jgi:hypothetical protein